MSIRLWIFISLIIPHLSHSAVTPATISVPPSVAAARPHPSSVPTRTCPRREDIHPCICYEVPGKNSEQIETVAFCKNIRNQEVLTDALKGFQHHRIDYFLMDSCKLPPFPNGFMHNVDIGWMEILNTTVQFQENFFKCNKGCL